MTQALHPELDIYFHLGLVPIPHDHNPSLSVNPEKRLWHCFGCGSDGDYHHFVEEWQGLKDSKEFH